MILINKVEGVADGQPVYYFSEVMTDDGTRLIEDLDRAMNVYIRQDFAPYLRDAILFYEADRAGQ